MATSSGPGGMQRPDSSYTSSRVHLIDLAVVGLVAMIVAGVWASISLGQQTSDALAYFQGAVSIVRGQGYLYNGLATAFWNPGYPFLLAAVFAVFGPSLSAMFVTNLTLYAASAALTYLLACKVGLS